MDLVVEVDRPRLGVDVLPSVQHEGLDPMRGEQRRRHHARGSGADDDDRVMVDGRRGHREYRTVVRCTPSSSIASSVPIVASTTSPSCR